MYQIDGIFSEEALSARLVSRFCFNWSFSFLVDISNTSRYLIDTANIRFYSIRYSKIPYKCLFFNFFCTILYVHSKNIRCFDRERPADESSEVSDRMSVYLVWAQRLMARWCNQLIRRTKL